MNRKNIPSGELKEGCRQSDSTTESLPEVAELKAQMVEMQMEIDILKETINVLKKDPGIDQTSLRNKEKAVIIDALKAKYSLPCLLEKLHISKSSYYYQEKVLSQPDKYLSLRIHIKELFTENKNRYGYRRIHALLKREGITISEKIIGIYESYGVQTKSRVSSLAIPRNRPHPGSSLVSGFFPQYSLFICSLGSYKSNCSRVRST